MGKNYDYFMHLPLNSPINKTCHKALFFSSLTPTVSFKKKKSRGVARWNPYFPGCNPSTKKNIKKKVVTVINEDEEGHSKKNRLRGELDLFKTENKNKNSFQCDNEI